jgi:HAAS domain-containing protein
MTETPSVEAGSIDQYLRKIESRLRRQGLSTTAMSEILAELKSHMIDRVAELEQAGAPQPVQQALQAMGDPDTIADEFLGLRKLKLASRSVLPGTLLAAAWRLTVAGGRSLLLFFCGLVGYTTCVAMLLAAVLKLVIPSRVGLWIGDSGLIWGIPPADANGLELAGDWFAPISVCLAIVFCAGTTMLLRKQLRSFAASRRS